MVTSTPLKSSSDVFDWLGGFVNFERGQNLKNFCLDRMETLAKLSGHPEKSAPSFHVAGSKGKGSVTGMIAAILEASGIRTAIYASPHVFDFRERLRTGCGFFEENVYVNAGNELKDLVSVLANSSYSELKGEEPSFFELMTLWFFLCARLANCGAMSLETGMGGRLDATNIVNPLVSIITLIELEHTEYLGTTIPAIAGEKAGIIKPGRPFVLSEQKPEALEVFIDHSIRKKSRLIYFPENAEIVNISVNREGTSFDYKEKNCAGGSCGIVKNLFLPMPGEVQAYNAGLAILALRTAYPDIEEESIRKGLAGFSLPARFEKISDTPPLVIDGAHTKQSMELCVKTFTGLYGTGAILVFGCAAGKDLLSMAWICVPCFSRIIITTPGTFKVSRPREIYDFFSQEAENQEVSPDILFIPETERAIDTAINLALENELPVLGTGSFYLAGEIRKRILKIDSHGGTELTENTENEATNYKLRTKN